MSVADLRATAAHVFVADLDTCVLDDADRHHLAAVLRLRDGEVVSASDGHGRVRLCSFRVGAGAPDRVPELAPRSGIHAGPDLGPPFSVGVALVKGDRPEWAVQKLTEIGAACVVLFVADRSVVRWDAPRRARVTERFARIAREAAMQSRRCTVPHVGVEGSLADALDLAARITDGPSARADPDGMPLTSGELASVFIGPEGGWSDAEVALVPRTCGLGPTVLRSETAAVVAASLLRRVPS